jgi:hypothetical protein
VPVSEGEAPAEPHFVCAALHAIAQKSGARQRCTIAGMSSEPDDPDGKEPPSPGTFRADVTLLIVTALYCLVDLVGILSSAHGVFGREGLTVCMLLACAGPLLWFGILGIALNDKTFSSATFAVASIAILGMTAWSFWALSEGAANA